MMKYVKFAVRYSYHQLKNIAKILLGKPLNYAPLGSTTLDEDDVLLAKKLLKRKQGWYDKSIVKEFEKSFADWNGSKYAYAFMGGRVALSAAIYALGLKPGDEVIVPGYTCVVVPNAFRFAEIKVTYSDIELDTFGLDASLIESKITNRTKAILLHHLYGIVCRDYEKIIEIGRKHGLFIIEDCAQSTGAEYKGKKIGNYGDIAIYSTEQSKVFTTIQGGLAVTNKDEFAARLEEFYEAAHYPDEDLIVKQLLSIIINYYSFKDTYRWWKRDLYRGLYKDKIVISTTNEEIMGKKPPHYGAKMPGAIAAIGLNQLKKIDNYNQARRITSKKWDSWCEEQGYKKPLVLPESVPVFLRYPVLVEPEKKLNTTWAAKEFGVELGVWFISHIHPSNEIVEGCPNADIAVKKCVNFPCLL